MFLLMVGMDAEYRNINRITIRWEFSLEMLPLEVNKSLPIPASMYDGNTLFFVHDN